MGLANVGEWESHIQHYMYETNAWVVHAYASAAT